jgi:hypothetical protein
MQTHDQKSSNQSFNDLETLIKHKNSPCPALTLLLDLNIPSTTPESIHTMPAMPVSQINVAKKSAARANGAPVSKTAQVAKATPPIPHAANGASPYQIMAARIANRVAEMAENVTFAERPVP